MVRTSPSAHDEQKGDPLHEMTKGCLMYLMPKGDLLYQITKGWWTPLHKHHLQMTTCYFLSLLLFHFFWPLISFSHFISSFVKESIKMHTVSMTASNALKHLINDKTNAIPRYPVMENNTDKPRDVATPHGTTRQKFQVPGTRDNFFNTARQLNIRVICTAM